MSHTLNLLLVYLSKILDGQTFSIQRIHQILVIIPFIYILLNIHKWVVRRQHLYVSLAFIALIYGVIHIAHTSEARYMAPVLPIYVLFFGMFMCDLRKYKPAFNIILLVAIGTCISLAFDRKSFVFKLIINFSLFSVLFAAYYMRYSRHYKYAVYTLLSLLIFFSVATHLRLSLRDERGAIYSTRTYGYNREIATLLSFAPFNSRTWINNIGVDRLSYFYMRETRGQRHNTLFTFPTPNFNAFIQACMDNTIEYIIAVQPTTIGSRLFDYDYTMELSEYPGIMTITNVKMQGKVTTVFRVESLTRKSALSVDVQPEEVVVSLPPSREDARIQVLVQQHRAYIKYLQHNAIHTRYFDSVLEGGAWDTDSDVYYFNGLNDFIPLRKYRPMDQPGLRYNTLIAWVRPERENQSAVIAGNFSDRSYFWNTVGSGIRYENGHVVVMAREAQYQIDRPLLRIPHEGTEWFHVAVVFQEDGAVYINGEKVAEGDFASSYRAYSFGIGALQVIPGDRSRVDRFFAGNLDDIRIYHDVLTPNDIHNIWLATRHIYHPHYEPVAPDTLSVVGLHLEHPWQASSQSIDLFGVTPGDMATAVLNTNNPVTLTYLQRVPYIAVAPRSRKIVVKEVSGGQETVSFDRNLFKDGEMYVFRHRYVREDGSTTTPSEPVRIRME